jgi:hypothetical protein
VIARRAPPFRACACRPRKTRRARVVASRFYVSNPYLRSPNAVLASALTRRKQKTRSARAVRVPVGANALRERRLLPRVFKKCTESLHMHVQVGAHSVPGLFRCQQKSCLFTITPLTFRPCNRTHDSWRAKTTAGLPEPLKSGRA